LFFASIVFSRCTDLTSPDISPFHLFTSSRQAAELLKLVSPLHYLAGAVAFEPGVVVLSTVIVYSPGPKTLRYRRREAGLMDGAGRLTA
jgi:hypothetical protein